MCRTKRDGGNLNGVERMDDMRTVENGMIESSIATHVMGKLKDSGYNLTTNTVFSK